MGPLYPRGGTQVNVGGPAPIPPPGARAGGGTGNLRYMGRPRIRGARRARGWRTPNDREVLAVDEMRQVGTDYADLPRWRPMTPAWAPSATLTARTGRRWTCLRRPRGPPCSRSAAARGASPGSGRGGGNGCHGGGCLRLMLDYVRRKAAEAGTARRHPARRILTMDLRTAPSTPPSRAWRCPPARPVEAGGPAQRPRARSSRGEDLSFGRGCSPPAADEAPEPHFERFAASLRKCGFPRAARGPGVQHLRLDHGGLLRRAGFDIVSQGVPVESLAVYSAGNGRARAAGTSARSAPPVDAPGRGRG
jgi:hypothetical protein